MFNLLKSLIAYELSSVHFKNLVESFRSYRVMQGDYEVIQDMGLKVNKAGHDVLVKLKNLRNVHKQYRIPFIFKKKVSDP